MRKIKIFLGFLIAVGLGACSGFVDPAIPYSDFETGVYLRTLSVTPNFEFSDLANAKFSLMVEAVDIEDGKLVSEVTTFVKRRRANTLSPEAEVKTTDASAFQRHSVIIPDVHPASGSKYPAATIEVTITEALQAMGMTLDDINGGDFFEFRLELVTTDGRTFSNNNRSLDVETGGYYRSPFFYRIPVVCTSALAGTFDYVHTDMFCDGQITGTVTWTAVPNTTNYTSNDFAFGSWNHCYGAGSGVPGGNLQISDACNRISVTGADQFGDTYTYKIIAVSGTSLTIEWSNTYGEFGTVVLTRQDGKNWPALRN